MVTGVLDREKFERSKRLMEGNIMKKECSNYETCVNFQEKQEPKYKVGDELLWNGVIHYCISEDSFQSPRNVTVYSIINKDGTESHQKVGCFYRVKENGLDLFEDDLSPLPQMYIGKRWVLKQEGNPWHGFEVECVREANHGLGKHEQIKGYGDNDLLYESWTSFNNRHFIIQCVDPKFWTGKICGEKVRCYEDANSDIQVYSLRDCVMLEAIKNANIPIMPYSQSKGDYTPLKEE